MEADPDDMQENEAAAGAGDVESPAEQAEQEETPLFEDYETGDSFEPTTETDEPPEEARGPIKVFISYKRDVYDQEVAARLYADLSRKNYEVFLDRQTPSGMEFEVEATTFLDQADYVIVLLSTHYINDGHYGRAELERASGRYKREKRPTIIPVRLDMSQLGLTLTAYIGRIQAIFWVNQDYWELLEKIECALSKKPLPMGKPSAIGLDPFLIGKSRRERIKSTFVEPPGYSLNGSLAESKKVWWIVGDTEVRNYLAVSVATRQPTEAVYEISKKTWLEVYNSGITDSTIVLRDVMPAKHFSEEAAGDELSSLASLIGRNNILIATISRDAFSQARHEMCKYDFKDLESVEVGSALFNKATKTEIFTKLLEYSYKSGDIGAEQYKWARSLIPGRGSKSLGPVKSEAGGLPDNGELIEETGAKFQEVIERWSPTDVERFVRLGLHQIKRYSDLLKLLQRNATLDDEIKSWFVSLDDSTRCFILILAIFYELDNESFWSKYKLAVQHLQKIAPHLSPLNLGICRQYAAPYVSTEGSVDFVDERVADAISQELAKSYREYFVELIPKLKEWSVPAERQSQDKNVQAERKRRAEQTKPIRLAIARAAGKFGRLGIDDLLEIIDFWATDPLIQIRDTAAVAVEQIVQNAKAANYLLDLLEQWGTPSPNKALNYRMHTAALCLARVVTAKSDGLISTRALDGLEGLAKSKKPGVKFHVSVALQRMAREVPLIKIQSLATSVASNGVPALRLNVANALNQSRSVDDEIVTALLEKWSLSENAKLRWTAFCCPIIQRETNYRRPGKGNDFVGDRNKQLLSFLYQDAALLANVFIEAISNDHHGKTAFACFEDFVLGATAEHRPQLVLAFASIPLERLEPKLFDPLRRSDHRNVEHLVIEIREAAWRQALSKPPDFLNLLNEKLRQEQRLRETFDTLVSLLRPEPQDHRGRVVRALANCYPRHRNILETVLIKLNDIAPSYFEPITQQVWQQVLRNLFSDPPAFLAFINDNLKSESRRDLALATIEAVAQNFLNEVLQALAFNYSLQAPEVKHALRVFRDCQSRLLNRVAREFYYRLLEGDLFNPLQLVHRLRAAFQDADERPAFLDVLQLLYASTTKGRKEAIIETFVQALDAVPDQVTALLSSPYVKEWPNLESLQVDISRAHDQSRSIVARLLNRFFTPDR
jgi:hypothetical protein